MSLRISEEWKPISLSGRLMLIVSTAVILYFHFSRSWVPILDDANLVFHEAGHPIFGLLGSTLGILGGTLGQLAFPIVTVITFYRRGESLGVAMGALWFFENWLNIARYMADARAQILPLVGGGEHDWFTMFSWVGLLNFDTKIAGLVKFLAWIGVLYTLVKSLKGQTQLSSSTPKC